MGNANDIGYSSFYIYNELEQDSNNAYRAYNSGSLTMEERALQLGFSIDDGNGW